MCDMYIVAQRDMVHPLFVGVKVVQALSICLKDRRTNLNNLGPMGVELEKSWTYGRRA